MTLSVGILCTLQRYGMAVNLRHEIGLPSIIYCDQLRQGVWPSTRKLLGQLIETKAQHLLLLQEDVLPCDKLDIILPRVIEANPENIISLYLPRSWQAKALAAQRKGQSWICTRSHPGSPAILLPREIAIDFLRWEEANCHPSLPYEETRLWAYAQSHELFFWITHPSLVQHMGAEVSTLGFNHPGKVSIDFKRDAGGVDWRRLNEKPWADDHFYDHYFTSDTFKGKLNVS